jgi:class 3 adenylate cyclase
VTELDEAADEILQRAIAGEDLGRLLARAARALCTAGLPVLRCSIAIPTLDPTVRGHNWIWRRRDCVAESDQATLETLPHDDAGESADQRTAIGVMLERQVFMHSWRLDRGGADIAVIPLLADLRAQGMTEFAMRLVPFAEGGALLGCAFSMATDRACGFSAADVAAPRRLGPTLALAAYRHGLAQNAASALQVYLGTATGPRVLAGAIRRGDGELIRAAILLADLRGFTALSGRAAPSDVVRWLNEYFDAIGGPIVERGGEILKFLGDGLLAVFPAAAEQSAQEPPAPSPSPRPRTRWRGSPRSMRGAAAPGRRWRSTSPSMSARSSTAISARRAGSISPSSAAPSTRRAGWRSYATGWTGISCCPPVSPPAAPRQGAPSPVSAATSWPGSASARYSSPSAGRARR